MSGLTLQEMELFAGQDLSGLQCYQPNTTVLLEVLAKSYCLLYGIPSLILYVLVVLALRRNRAFYSPTFVHLFSLICILNIGCWIMEYIFSRIFCVSHFCHFMVSLTATYYLVLPFAIYQFFPLASFVCCVLIALYQTTALVAPLDIEKKFGSRLNVFTVLTIVIPFVSISHLFFAYTTVMPLPSGKIYVKTMHWNDWLVELNTPLVNSLVGGISFVVIIICTIISIIRLIQLRHKQDKRVQFRVIFVIFLITTTSLFFAVYQIILFYVRAFERDNYKIADVIQWREIVVDICYLPLPWVVVLVSSRVRRSLPVLTKHQKQKKTMTNTWATSVAPSIHITSDRRV